MLWMSLLYGALVIYGTLFPLSEWSPPLLVWSNPITQPWPDRASRADIIINVLAYIPLGLFLALWLRPRLGLAGAILAASLFGCGLSFTLEVLQSALPSRVPSLLDWVTNASGTALGALIATAVDPRLPVGRILLKWRQEWFDAGRLINLALVILGLWALTQTAPFVPSLDWGNLKSGLKPLGNTLRHPGTFQFTDALAMGSTLLALGLIALHAARRPVLLLFLTFSFAVLLAKVPVVGRQLTLEALAGWSGAILILFALARRTPAATRLMLAAAALLSAYALTQFKPGIYPDIHAINWIPFQGQVGTLVGMNDILETLWPFMALGLALRWLTPWRWRRSVMLGGGLLVAALAFALEWMQQSIPGRFADITDVLLASLGWCLPWLLNDTRGRANAPDLAPTPRQMRWAVPALAATMASLSFAGWLAGGHVRVETDERGRAVLPAPENLVPIHLPGFRETHPRLPHPSVMDITRLRQENPQWLKFMQSLARGGAGDLNAVITMAYIEPGSQDLALLHRRLLAIKYSYRGQQAKPIAHAYDWLYAQWDDTQRLTLREKLADGVGYLVNFIRRDRLSPYNVYLYNSPFQALLAANLALYGDDPRGELNMRFTYDLWKHRVLPAWRQVMGQSGGWHEGGEYIGIGIGQAIYQAPAMWRSATGEDLFSTEPGLRGFLDFVTYRRRPDNTDFRWGDAGYFNKIVPDVVPLSLEYRHAAAYNLRPPRPLPVPSSWPWGPLTDATLLNPEANQTLPLAKHFDGIGLVVARSDWTPDATYVTFRAGDNFWSHSHLDQGAFTLYKGGELALDSGFYGPKYGSDHHMNYTYQSIAHNLITVTDPDDDAPSSGKNVRMIANDGGQRRIGSGWGLASAPIDLNDWLDQRDLYHTATLQRYFEGHDSVVAVADITPAYSNNQSKPGEFSHRTRRVERMWRTFIYDRASDVVIVRDLVRSAHPEFRKRWLLHTQTEPHITGQTVSVVLPPNAEHAQSGGSLDARVLLPDQAKLEKVGGRGYEFFVDGKNYDENGTLAATIQKKGQPTEAGNWRLEVSPLIPQQDDEFLVVLIPRGPHSSSLPRIRKLARNHEHGVEILAATGARRWWFTPERNGVRLEAAQINEQIFPPHEEPADARTPWKRLKAWWHTMLN
jgi:glycopeptide antibiotics resistance protein